MYQKLLKSVNFSQCCSKNKKVEDFWVHRVEESYVYARSYKSLTNHMVSPRDLESDLIH